MALEGAAEAPPGALAPAGPSAASPATPAGWGSNGGSLLVSRERLVAPPDRTLALPHLALLQHLAGRAASAEGRAQLRLLQHLLLGFATQQQAQAGRELLDGFSRLASPATAPSSGLHADFASKVPPPEPLPPESPTAAAAAAGEGAAAAVASKPGAGPPPGAGQQLRFLRRLCAAMAAAGYRLLTRQEWEAALCENYLFTLPTVADYASMDATLLPPLEQLQPGGGPAPPQPPQLAGRALIWHRGAAVARASNPAWALKLDCLISFWLLQPLWTALAWLLALAGVRLPALGVPGVTQRPFAQPAAGGRRSTASAPPAPSSAGTEPAVPAGAPTGRAIERRTFARAFPSGRAVWRQLLKPVQLQEACFEDVVLLYRPAAAAAAAAAGAVERRHAGREQPAGSVEESVGGSPDEARGCLGACLALKRFRRVPLADLEMVLPGARLFLAPNLYLSLAFTLASGLVAAAVAAWQAAWGAGLLRALAAILLSRAYQVHVYISNERTALAKHMTQLLYDRAAASQAAVLHTLSAEVAGQRARELLLCYWALLEAGGALTAQEVGQRCDELLQRGFGLSHVQVDAAPPLAQLQRWGLAQHLLAGPGSTGPQPAFAAVPLEAAVERLREVWRALAELEEEEGEAPAPAGAPHAAPALPAASPEAPAEAESAAEAEAAAAGAAGKPEAAAMPAAAEAPAVSEPAQPVEPAAEQPQEAGLAAAAPQEAGEPVPAPVAEESAPSVTAQQAAAFAAALEPAPAPARAVPAEQAVQIVPGGYVPAEPEPEVVKTAPAPAAEAREAPPTPLAHPAGLPPASSGGARTVSVERLSPPHGPRPGSPGSKSRLSRLLHGHVL